MTHSQHKMSENVQFKIMIISSSVYRNDPFACIQLHITTIYYTYIPIYQKLQYKYKSIHTIQNT